jgi:hypothetical protein
MPNETEWSLDLFIERFKTIALQGWVRTHRAGPTGIGKTLEDLLGIKENNIQGPDFGTYELKSMRKDANSMLTLITKSPDMPAKANTALRQKFGYSSSVYDNEEKVLHATLSSQRYSPIANTGHSLKVVCNAESINIVSEDGTIEAQWKIATLISKMDTKLGDQFVLVRALNRGIGAEEDFKFEEAYLLDGFNSSGIIKLVNDGKILVDLRIGQYHEGKNKGKTHDHGTGFRIFERDYIYIFNLKRIV